MPTSSVQGNHDQGLWSAWSEGSRPTKPCRVCQVQVGATWIYVAHCVAAVWLDRRWARTTKNKAFYGTLHVVTIAAIYMLSDEPYYCEEWHQAGSGRHLWRRQAASVVQVGRILGEWFREWFAFPQRYDSTQEPEADGDYDRCDVE